MKLEIGDLVVNANDGFIYKVLNIDSDTYWNQGRFQYCLWDASCGCPECDNGWIDQEDIEVLLTEPL